MPNLVVGMPAYNAESTVRRAVLSTLRALPADSSLVVVNDASTDRTGAVLESIHDRRLTVVTNSENSGGGSARNRLLAETDSEFIAWIDADDVSLPGRFSLQSKAARSADVVFGSALRFGGRLGQVRPSSPLGLNPEELPAALLFHNTLCHSSTFARRSAIEKVGGYRPVRYGQDWELWLRLARSGARLQRLAMPVVGYRGSGTQVTKSADYREKVLAFGELQTAYIDLFNSKVTSAPLEAGLSPAVAAERIETGLWEQLRHFRPLNRQYYAHLLRSRRAQNLLKDRLAILAGDAGAI